MALHDRVKAALDEARTLILGVQILPGFQYQAAFQERFDTLPPPARIMATDTRSGTCARSPRYMHGSNRC